MSPSRFFATGHVFQTSRERRQDREWVSINHE